jgi:hypothetical protein
MHIQEERKGRKHIEDKNQRARSEAKTKPTRESNITPNPRLSQFTPTPHQKKNQVTSGQGIAHAAKLRGGVSSLDRHQTDETGARQRTRQDKTRTRQDNGKTRQDKFICHFVSQHPASPPLCDTVFGLRLVLLFINALSWISLCLCFCLGFIFAFALSLSCLCGGEIETQRQDKAKGKLSWFEKTRDTER